MTIIEAVPVTRPRLFVVPVPAALVKQAGNWFAHHSSPATALLGLDEAWFLDASQADDFAEALGADWGEAAE